MSEVEVEVEILRDRLASMHQLNGWSKSKGWWCSCRGWWARLPYATAASDYPQPWARRDDAARMHAAHIADELRSIHEEALRGGQP